MRLFTMVVAFAVAVGIAGEAAASEASIAVGEVTAPPPGFGIDATALRAAATDEIRLIDPASLPPRRKVVVSLALTKAVAEKTVTFTVNAMVRDAQTGVMLAIIEGGAHAEGPASNELKKQVAQTAVRSAVRRIPRAIGGR